MTQYPLIELRCLPIQEQLQHPQMHPEALQLQQQNPMEMTVDRSEQKGHDKLALENHTLLFLVCSSKLYD
jgi:hypothetical protein